MKVTHGFCFPFEIPDDPTASIEGDSDQGDELSSDEETNEMSQRVKELLAAEKENQDNSSTEEEDTSDNDEQDLEENDDEDTAGKKDFMAEIKKISKDDFHSQSDSGKQNDSISYEFLMLKILGNANILLSSSIIHLIQFTKKHS